MILPLHDRVRDRVRAAIADALRPRGLPRRRLIPIESPPNRTLGDLGSPTAFDLARRLRKAPRAIAQEIADAFGSVDGVARVVAAPNGYLNVFLDRPMFLLQRLGVRRGTGGGVTPMSESHRRTYGDQSEQGRAHRPSPQFRAGRHAGPGAWRSAGTPVEIQNYIDDTGVQVADVVVGFPYARGARFRERAGDRRLDAVRLLLLGSLRPRHGVVSPATRSG